MSATEIPADSQACFIIPVFKNPERLQALLRSLAGQHLPVFVAETGIPAALPDLSAGHAQVEIVPVADYRGAGSALEVLLRRARDSGAKWAVSLDGDGIYAAEDIWRLLGAAVIKPQCLVIGTCRTTGPLAWQQRLERSLSNLWFWMETGQNLPDIRSRFRIYPLASMSRLHIRSRGVGWEVESMVRASWGGLRLLPITVDGCQESPLPAPGLDNLREFLRLGALHVYLVFRRLSPWPFLHVVEREKIIWPAGWLPKIKFIWKKYIWQSDETPEEAGLAIGVGVFVGVLPFWGWHTLIAFYLAQRLHLNLVLVIAASYLALPPFIPVILYISLVLGKFMLSGEWAWHLPWSEFSWAMVKASLKELLVGNLILAIFCGIAAGMISQAAIKVFKARISRI